MFIVTYIFQFLQKILLFIAIDLTGYGEILAHMYQDVLEDFFCFFRLCSNVIVKSKITKTPRTPSGLRITVEKYDSLAAHG